MYLIIWIFHLQTSGSPRHATTVPTVPPPPPTSLSRGYSHQRLSTRHLPMHRAANGARRLNYHQRVCLSRRVHRSQWCYYLFDTLIKFIYVNRNINRSSGTIKLKNYGGRISKTNEREYLNVSGFALPRPKRKSAPRVISDVGGVLSNGKL